MGTLNAQKQLGRGCTGRFQDGNIAKEVLFNPVKAAVKIVEKNGFAPEVSYFGVTKNVSYGLPNRKLINRSFLDTAITCGLDSAIMDPTDKFLFGALTAIWAITGKDDFCMEYITALRDGSIE